MVQASRFLSPSVTIKWLSNAKYMVTFILANVRLLVLLTYEKPVALEFIPGIVCGEKFERYCFLVRSTKNLTFVNINVTIHLALHNNFVFTDGDKKRLACIIHKHLLTNKYLVVLLTFNTVT